MTLAVGRGPCPALPALPTAFFCLRVCAHPNAPLVTTTTAAETVSVSVRTFRYSLSLPLKKKKKEGKAKSEVDSVKVTLASVADG